LFMSRPPRNVHVYSLHADPPVIVAGLYQAGSISVAAFYSMLDNVFEISFTPPFRLFQANDNMQRSGGALDREDQSILQAGNYVVLGPIGLLLL